MTQETLQTPEAPAHGWRTFLIVWVTQSVSVFGSALTFFAINIWLTRTLYARPEQKPQLAWALSAIGLAFALPTVLAAPIARRSLVGWVAYLIPVLWWSAWGSC